MCSLDHFFVFSTSNPAPPDSIVLKIGTKKDNRWLLDRKVSENNPPIFVPVKSIKEYLDVNFI